MRAIVFAGALMWLCSACASKPPVAIAADGARYAIHIGGRSLSMRCAGAGPGPVVILETGAAASSVVYWPLQDRIAAFARVCTYDRAGLGWSDPVAGGRTFHSMADDLDRLLRAANIRGPYILVGHSMGGFIVRLAAARRPGEIAGIVLIDASEEGQALSADGIAGNDQTAVQMGRLAVAAESGMNAIVEGALPILASSPPEASVIRKPEVIRAGQDELGAFGRTRESERQSAGLGQLGTIPLIVLARGRMASPPSARDVAWRKGQERLPTLSTQSQLIVVEDSGHNMHLDQPEAIVDAIRQLLQLED